MTAFSCPTCSHSPVDIVEFTDDARMRMHCGSCDHAWTHPPKETVAATGPASAPTTRPTGDGSTGQRAPSGGTAARRTTTERDAGPVTRDQALARFPAEDDVPESARARLVELKGRFLRTVPRPAPEPEQFRFYQLVFSAEGLEYALPADLREFAHTPIGTVPGSLSGFNATWNKLGDRDAADQVRSVVEHLLRGTEPEHVEDRMQALIEPGGPGMNGFREALLTRVLCVAHPERFLPILTYTASAGGKREIAAAVFDLDLPAPRTAAFTTGRLAVWSNDLLLRLCGTGFVDVAHVAEFLWWAKDEPRS